MTLPLDRGSEAGFRSGSKCKEFHGWSLSRGDAHEVPGM